MSRGAAPEMKDIMKLLERFETVVYHDQYRYYAFGCNPLKAGWREYWIALVLITIAGKAPRIAVSAHPAVWLMIAAWMIARYIM